MLKDNDVVIVSAVRTPFDKFGGVLKEVPSIELGAAVIKEVIERVNLNGSEVEEVFYGTCLPAETAMETNIPARLAMLKAGLPPETRSLTIDRACCSSLTAVSLCFEAIKSGRAKVCLAAGAENMSRASLLIPSSSRWGTRVGNLTVVDVLFQLGYRDYNPVSVDAGEVAVEMGVNREEQDNWAHQSQQRYARAFEQGKFKVGGELMSLTLPSKKGSILFETDSGFRPNTTIEQLSSLKPVYGSPTVTAGNAPGLNAGAAAILIMSRAKAKELNLKPMATILSGSGVAGPAREIAKIPATAIKKALEIANLKLEDLKLIEINEAFAAMPLVASKILADGNNRKLQDLRNKINVNGGAIAIGHPVGASGARILMTLMYELQRKGGGLGAATICGGLCQGEAATIQV